MNACNRIMRWGLSSHFTDAEPQLRNWQGVMWKVNGGGASQRQVGGFQGPSLYHYSTMPGQGDLPREEPCLRRESAGGRGDRG